MYAVNITRTNDEINFDMLIGKNSMDAKSKVMKYIFDFVLVNYNIFVDNDILDQNLSMELFSLRNFMINNYNINIKKNLIIQTMPTDREHCLFVKYYDVKKDEIPFIYIFNKNDEKKANNFMSYLINDALIKKYENNLAIYERLKQKYNTDIKNYKHDSIRCEKISLYDGGLFLEKILNNSISYNQLKKLNVDIQIKMI